MIEIKHLTKVYKLNKKQMAESQEERSHEDRRWMSPEPRKDRKKGDLWLLVPTARERLRLSGVLPH